jgi:DNA-binding transcriptional MerR regulator
MKDLQIKKLYYSISEVSRMLGLEQYVLRYWETEFEQLRPQKNRAGNRIYTEKDIDIIRLIKKLTREDRYTIPGARQVLNTMSLENGVPAPGDTEAEVEEEMVEENEEGGEESELIAGLRMIRSSLMELRRKLDPGSNGNAGGQ